MNQRINFTTRRNGRAFEREMERALQAFHHLDKLGCHMLSLEIHDRRPILVISPPDSAFLTGAMKKRITIGTQTLVTMAASVHGCQVEWCERHPAPRREASVR